MITFVVRFPTGFSDFNILPKKYKRGEIESIEGEQKFNQVRQSQPDLELLERKLKINKKSIPTRKAKNAKA